MKSNVNIDNRIFIYAFFGVLLFIAAMGFIIANMAEVATIEFSYPLAGILGIPSISLLYKAIKGDRRRFRI
jgi:hypothetical protein